MRKHSLIHKMKHLLLREPKSQSQLIDVLRDAEQRKLIDPDKMQMIEGVLVVSEKKVREVMIPRKQMVVIKGSAKPMDALPEIIHSQHSRFPVVGDTLDEIIGILLAKDILPVLVNPPSDETIIKDFTRPPLVVPETKRLDVLLKEFQQERHHMAIVVDEFGVTAGLITIEDILEEIVGDIDDEYDISEKNVSIQPVNKNNFHINALTPISEFNAHFNTNFSNEDFDTIGGLVLQAFGRLPKRNEKIELGDFEVTVLKASRRGVQRLQFKRKL